MHICIELQKGSVSSGIDISFLFGMLQRVNRWVQSWRISSHLISHFDSASRKCDQLWRSAASPSHLWHFVTRDYVHKNYKIIVTPPVQYFTMSMESGKKKSPDGRGKPPSPIRPWSPQTRGIFLRVPAQRHSMTVAVTHLNVLCETKFSSRRLGETKGLISCFGRRERQRREQNYSMTIFLITIVLVSLDKSLLGIL